MDIFVLVKIENDGKRVRELFWITTKAFNPSEQTNIKRYGNRETGKRAPYLSL